MRPSVTVVDYDSGNILSVRRALERCGGDVILASSPELIAKADRLVLPGVGAFASCMRALQSRGLADPIRAFVRSGRPFLGICVGMQILFEVGEEFGSHAGLGILPGKVAALPVDRQIRLPHIGWAPLEAEFGWEGSILQGIWAGDEAYFVHSFAAQPECPEHCLATANYGGKPFCAAVSHENVSGAQFHPEKSGPVGLKIITSFLQI